MLFNSPEYMLFLPIVFLLYWLTTRSARSQNALLLLVSYIFYGWWDWRFLGLIFGASVMAYTCGSCLGEPPHTFTWRYKDKEGNIKELTDYTPLQFYKEITPSDYNPEHYVMIMNDPTREYYKLYEIQNYRNAQEGINWIYLNLPNEDIKQAALASIKNNEAMYASCDVGKQHQRESGILDPRMYDYESLFGVKLNMDKKTRILTRQSGSSHAMTLIGCDTDSNDRPVKWEFENSWGAGAGNKGYLTFTDDWFDEYMFRIVIHRKYLNEKAIASLKQKPVPLPVWDYMY